MTLARGVLLCLGMLTDVRTILVATDFGPASNRALDDSIELAERFDAKLIVLHVLEPAPRAYALGARAAPLPIEALNAERAAARQALDITMAGVRKRRPNARGVLHAGKPWSEIAATAEEFRADIVVVGSHGRRGLSHRFLGSVADRVVRLSVVPVLTVHGFWFEDRAHAGQQLAAELEPLRPRSPAIVAISRGGILVGAEIARNFDTSLEVLLTRGLETDGTSLGAVCEGGIAHFAPEAVQNGAMAEKEEKLLAQARTKLQEDATRIRGSSGLGDLWRRTVVVVSDGFAEPWRAMAAAGALAKLSPDTIVLAAPVASEEALSALRARFPDVVVLHTLHPCGEVAAAYRDFRMLSDRTLGRLLQDNTMHLSAHSA